MDKQRFLKRKAFLTLFVGILLVCGCGQNESSKIDQDPFLTETGIPPVKREETDTTFTETKGTGQDEEPNEPSEDSPKPFEIPLNTKAEDILYDSEDYVDFWASISTGISDGKNIYLADAQEFYVMAIGTDKLTQVNIDIPEGMIIYHLALDSSGRIHLLLGNYDKEEYFILRLDESYQIDKTIDISTCVEEKQMPNWFLIHKDGIYFIQWGFERNGILVDSEGVLKHTFTRESLGIHWTRQAAVGKDGEIYLVYGDPDEKWQIGKLDMKTCLLENENPALSFPGNEIFIAIGSGTDTNLLLLSLYSGVWACDTKSGVKENRTLLSDICSGFDREAELGPRIFLPDGRLFLIGRATKDTATDDLDDQRSQHEIFRYIPVGK